jgi:hypothetical protein
MAGSIDSLLISVVMAIAGCPQAYRRQAIFGFMAFDFVAACTGWSSGVSPALAVLSVLALSCPVLYAARTRAALYALLPILCSIDNLLIGASDSPLQLWLATRDAICSGILAWAGFTFGTSLTGRMKGVAE